MARELKNHPGFFLNDAAAADFDRMEDDHGVFNVTSARRSEAEQQNLVDRWDRGGVYNRPPYLYEPYRPARLGPHVRNDGCAVDVADWQRMLRVMGAYHFTHPYDWDVVHFEHDGNRDTLNNLNTPPKKYDPKGKNPMFIAAIFPNLHPTLNGWFLIGPTGRAVVLSDKGGKEAQAQGVPVVAFDTQNSVDMLVRQYQF